MLCTLLIAATLGFADDAPPKGLEAVQRSTAQYYEREKAEARRVLNKIRSGQINRRAKRVIEPGPVTVGNRRTTTKSYIFPSKADKDRYIKLAESLIEGLERNERLGVAQYGEIRYQFRAGDVGSLPSVNVLQVVDESTMLVRYLGERVLVKGVSTKGVADGDEIVPRGIYIVADPTTYRTVLGGTNTVLVFEPIDTAAIQTWMTKIAKGEAN